MIPLNRYVRVEIKSESPAEGDVLMPDGYKVAKEWESAQVRAVSSDCKMFEASDVGNTIIFPGNMLVTVDVGGDKHFFVQENYVVCKA